MQIWQTFSHLLDIVFSCEVIIKESTVLYVSHRKYRGSRPRARTCQQSFEHSHIPHWMEYTRDHLNMPIISAFSTTMYRPIGFLISEISMYSLHVKKLMLYVYQIFVGFLCNGIKRISPSPSVVDRF